MPRETRFEQVLESATALFADKGFAATSVRDVAGKARITSAGLYYHVDKKEDLLFHTCSRSIEEILAGARAAVAVGRDAIACLKGLIAVHFDYFRAHPERLVVLNREDRHLSPARRGAIAKLERDYFDLVRGVIANGQRVGQLRGGDPSFATFSLFAVLNGLDRWYDPKGTVDPDQAVGEIAALALDGLRARKETQDA